MQETDPSPRWHDRLSVQLLGFVIGIILLVELIIFVPSAVTFRDNWIDDRVQAATIAALALEAAPSQRVSDELSEDLLENAEVLTVAIIGEDRRQLVLAPREPVGGPMRDIKRTDEPYTRRLGHTLGMFFSGGTDILQVTSTQGMEGMEDPAPATDPAEAGSDMPVDSMRDMMIEVLMLQAPLRAELIDFSQRILGLSLLISIVAGGLVYLVLDFLVVRPMGRVTASIMRFRNDPGTSPSQHEISQRKNEIGRAQNALVDMETVVSDAFRQRERLAQLGQAVAKINHDLRNSLAAAQLVSDGLARSEDPRVQRAAPRLERALERAINLAQNTLEYGKEEPIKPNLHVARICEITQEAAEEALASFPQIKWDNQITPGTEHLIDPDHLHRIIANLVRNAAQATLKTRPNDGLITLRLEEATLLLSDNGPGLPAKAKDNLFVPFASSATKGGTGLGLAIARELSQAMGGDLTLEQTGPDGTTFKITLPPATDRPG